MKIRSKLIVAFLILTIFPTAIMFLCVALIFQSQTNSLRNAFGFDKNVTSSYELIQNPIAFFQKITNDDYNLVNEALETSNDALSSESKVKFLEKHLQNPKTYLVVFQDSKPIYIGKKEDYKKLSTITITSFSNKKDSLVYLEPDTFSIIREKSFQTSEKNNGRVFLITNCSIIKNHWLHAIKQLCLAFLLIIIITMTFTMIWIYQSILQPLNLLRLATTQIGSGNLEDPIAVTSNDEIGQLQSDLDDMRLHLKKIVNKGIQSEDNTREIMSSISHDLKTPITAIKGYTEGILDGVADTPEKQQKYLQTIYAKANDMTYLIDELSIYSKVEQNTLPYNFISVNLDNYFTDCIDEFSLDLESQNFHLDYVNETDKGTKIIADPEQLKRVINNLIGNAVKYSKPTGGHIFIRIKNVPTPENKPPLYRQLNEDGTDKFPLPSPVEFVQIQVEDNGLGIAKKDLPHIFDRFFRADTSRNSSKRGSGLGLAIVKMIISDHGGEVWVESTEGVGSSFYFTLKKDTNNDGGAYE